MNFKIITLFVLLLIVNTLSAKPSGKDLFKQCKACHTLDEVKLVGPGLAGVTEKRTKEWLKSWIRSSTKLIESGDKDAIALKEEFLIPMQDFDFSDEELDALIDYMGGKDEVKEVVATEVVDKKADKTIEKASSESSNVSKSEEVKEELDTNSFSKVFENHALTKFIYSLALMLLLFVFYSMFSINKSLKK